MLSLLSETDYIDEQDFIPSPQARSELVVEHLQSFERRMTKIRKEVAAIMAACLIKGSFFNNIVREEQIKNRTRSENVQPGDIMFCPRLYANTFNTSKSLVRLIFLGESRQSGVFKKIGKWCPDSLISREISDLYFVCKGQRNMVFENIWRPSFRMHEIIQDVSIQNTSLNFGNEPTTKMLQEFMQNCHEGKEEYENMLGVGGVSYFQEPAAESESGEPDPIFGEPNLELGETDQELGEPAQDLGEAVREKVEPPRSKYGRKLQKVQRYTP